MILCSLLPQFCHALATAALLKLRGPRYGTGGLQREATLTRSRKSVVESEALAHPPPGLPPTPDIDMIGRNWRSSSGVIDWRIDEEFVHGEWLFPVKVPFSIELTPNPVFLRLIKNVEEESSSRVWCIQREKK